MSEIVYVYNYGDTAFIDICAYEKVCIKAKEYIAMVRNKAIFFVGDGTMEEDKRVAFRRGDVKPTLQIFENIKDIPIVTPMTISVKPIEVTKVPTVEDGSDTISFGKFIGQQWDDVLSPENFDAGYWKSTVSVSKKIPVDRKTQIHELLTQQG